MPSCDAGRGNTLEAPKNASGENFERNDEHDRRPGSDRPEHISDARILGHVIVVCTQPKTRYRALGNSGFKAAKGPVIASRGSPSSVCQPPEMT